MASTNDKPIDHLLQASELISSLTVEQWQEIAEKYVIVKAILKPTKPYLNYSAMHHQFENIIPVFST